MQVVRDLAGGHAPMPIELFYNQQDDADASETRYPGSLVKLMDWNNAEGIQCCWAGESTVYENIIGILAEPPGTSGYLLTDATYGAQTKKIIPILPSSIVRAEYSQKDVAGTSNLESTATAAAGATQITGTTTDVDTDDLLIGGWLYFTNGANSGYLHYIDDSADSGETYDVATALNGALVATDDFIVVQAPMTLWLALDAEYHNLLSTVDDGARTLPVIGLMSYISDTGIPFQRLDRDLHDGLKLSNPRFYHDFLIGGSATLGNVWRDTVIRA